MKKLFSNKYINYFLIFFSFFALAVIFTYPLIINFSDSIVGWKSMNDGELFLWNFWWVKYSIFNIKTNPFYTNYVYFPQTVSLTLHTLTIFPALISSVFQLFTKNIVIVYNIMFLLTFAFSGLGTYLLVKYIYKNKFVAYIAGIAFAFCPYVFAHAYSGHFNLMNTWTIPFYLYFLLRMFDKKRLLDVFLASLIVTFQIYTDFHYLFYMFIFSVIILLFYIVKEKNKIKQNLKNSLILVFLIVIFSIPVIIPTYKFTKIYNEYQGQREYYEPAVEYTNLRHYFPGPNYQNKLLVSDETRDIVEKNYKGGIRENNIFIGYTIMFLAILGLIYSKNERKWLFLSIAIVFFILSLGTSLYLGETEISSIKLPAYYLSKYIFKNSDLVYGRFSIIVELMLVILASGFLVWFIREKKKLSKIVIPILIFFIIIEYINIPVTLTSYKQNDYLREISKDVKDFRIITIPNNLFYQTIIEKPQLVGALGRRAHDYYVDNGLYSEIPGIRLFYAVNNPSVVPNDDDKNIDLVKSQFEKYNIKYIILEKKHTPPPESIKLREIAESIMQLDIAYEDQDVVVYQVL